MACNTDCSRHFSDILLILATWLRIFSYTFFLWSEYRGELDNRLSTNRLGTWGNINYVSVVSIRHLVLLFRGVDSSLCVLLIVSVASNRHLGYY